MSRRDRVRARRRRDGGAPHAARAERPDERVPDQGGPLTPAPLWTQPLPLIGTTWLTRGAAYRRKRLGAALLYAVCLLFVGGLAAGFDAGLVSAIEEPALAVGVGVAYLLGPGVAGFVLGSRHLARRGMKPFGPRLPAVAGALVVFVLAPFAAGLCLAVLVGVLGRWFPGEVVARQEILRWQAGRHPAL